MIPFLLAAILFSLRAPDAANGSRAAVMTSIDAGSGRARPHPPRPQRGHGLSGVAARGASSRSTCRCWSFVIVLLFPFYWMAITAVKPERGADRLQQGTARSGWSPTLEHINKLLFETTIRAGCWNTMFIAAAPPSLAVGQRARGLCDPAPALQGLAICRVADLPRLSRAALDPVHPAGDMIFQFGCSTRRWR
jgi:hypothetical protein